MSKKGEPIGWFTANGQRIPIMEGQTKSDALKAFVKEKRDKTMSKAKTPEELNGKPGKYKLYRSGKLNTPSGMVFFGDQKSAADYADLHDDIVNEYDIVLNNPLRVEINSMDTEVPGAVAKALNAKTVGGSELTDKSWQLQDKYNAQALSKSKHDGVVVYDKKGNFIEAHIHQSGLKGVKSVGSEKGSELLRYKGKTASYNSVVKDLSLNKSRTFKEPGKELASIEKKASKMGLSPELEHNKYATSEEYILTMKGCEDLCYVVEREKRGTKWSGWKVTQTKYD